MIHMKNISQPGVNFRKALPCSEHLLNFALKPRVFYTKLVLYKMVLLTTLQCISDSYETRTDNNLFRKRTLSHLAKLAKIDFLC